MTFQPRFSITNNMTTAIVIVIRRKAHPVYLEVAGEVTGEVRKILLVCRGEMSRRQLQEVLSLKSEENFRQLYLMPALLSGFIEMTIPDKPNSRMQKYRLTPKGIALL
jgi:ATP-dependent DNA helicase RecG